MDKWALTVNFRFPDIFLVGVIVTRVILEFFPYLNSGILGTQLFGF